MNVVSNEQAVIEVNNWLDLKKVRAKKREEYKGQIDTLVESVEEGYLRIDEKGNMTQVLNFPIGDSNITELEYRLRATAGDVMEWTKGVKNSDGEGRILAVAAGLSGKATATLKKMDSTDNSMLQNIVIFFM